MINWNDKNEVDIFKEEERILHIAVRIASARVGAFDKWNLLGDFQIATAMNEDFKERVQRKIAAYRAENNR